jgi:hypothetical protein
VEQARQRLREGPPKGLLEHWHLAPGILKQGALEDFTPARFLSALRKKVLARTSELAAAAAGADAGGAAGSITNGTGNDSPAKRVKKATAGEHNPGRTDRATAMV